MSYPSIKTIVKKSSLNIAEAKQEELEALLWKAFETDLPDGLSFLRKLAEESKNCGQKILRLENPNSALGKQIIRLLGTDIARSILEKRFGVAFGFYNCCGAVAAPSRDKLRMSMKEQIELQNGVLASADC